MGVTKQVLDKALHHEGAVRLARVDARPNHHVLLPLVHGHAELALAVFELRELDEIVLSGVALDS